MKTFLRSLRALTLAVVAPLVLKATAFAQAYGCGAYGAGSYGTGDCVASTGEVADTGLNVWLIRCLAVVLILIAIYIVWRTSRKRRSSK